jgi:UDP-N-acetylmuramoylalanine--D-glutamate ligase
MIDLASYKGKTIAVMGLGKSGLATARALIDAGANVCAWDDAEKTRAAAGLPLSDLADQDWAATDFLVLSPGIPHTHPKPHPVAAAAKAAGCPIIGDVELLIRAIGAAKVIAITGTNGKSTTTALIGHILKSAGRETAVGGNLGTPVLDFPALGTDGFYVLELSSYQLETTPSLHAAVAVLLNISADHLDRHGGMDGYIEAKKRVFANQESGDAAVIGTDDAACAAICDAMAGVDGPTSGPRVIPISGHRTVQRGVYAFDRVLYDDRDAAKRPILSLESAATLPGDHNAQNAAAAAAACLMAGLTPDEIARGIESFPGLAHRQQLAAVIDGIRYINDSKATNADAAARALSSYRTIYWIAGGLAKEGGLDALMEYLPRIRHAYLIGEAEAAFAEILDGKLPISRCGTLDKALAEAHRLAQQEHRSGAVVLLSPACASWDQYPSFEVRGAEFCRLAAQLPGSAREIHWDGETERAA